MKRLLTLFALFISFGVYAQTTGIKIGTPIIKNAPTDNTITGYANLLNGGYHIVLTYHGRDSLTTAYSTTLRTGMLCYVSGVDSTYRWSGTAWAAVSSSSVNIYNSDGTITGNRTVSVGTSFALTFSTPHSGFGISEIGSGNTNVSMYAVNSGVGSAGQVSVTAGQAIIGVTNLSTSNLSALQYSNIGLATFTDQNILAGVGYDADYNINGISNFGDRWIGDVGYTKSLILTAVPSQTGNSGKFLTTNGTSTSWGTPSGGSGITTIAIASSNGFTGTSSGGTTPTLTLATSITGILKGNGTAISAATNGIDYTAGFIPTAVKTGAYTLANNDLVTTDASGGTVPLALPAAPPNGTREIVKMVTTTGTNATTIAAGGSDVFNKTGGVTSITLTTLNQAVNLEYYSGIWYVYAGELSLASLDLRYSPLAGSTSLVTVGTIGTGTWNGTIIAPQYGGTGVNNGSFTSTLAGNFVTAGAFGLTLTQTGTTNVTLPTSGTVATRAGAEVFTNKDLTSGTNTFPTFNQNTSGTASNLSGTPALPNGTTATTQTAGDNTTKLATTAFVTAAVGGGGAVTSVSNADGTLTISPTTGAVVASLNLSNTNTWGAKQTFGTNISIGGVTPTGATGTGNIVFSASPTFTGTLGSAFNISTTGNIIATNGIQTNGTLTNGNLGISATQTINSAIAQIQVAGVNTSFRNEFGGTGTNASFTSGNNSANNVFTSSIQLSSASSTTPLATNVAINTLGFTIGASGSLTNSTNLYVATAPTVGTTKWTAYFDTGNIFMNGIFGFNGTLGTANQVPVVNTGATAMTWANIPLTQASANLTAQTAAVTVTTFTVGASTATFDITAYLNITAVTVDVIETQVTYTDENNTSQTANFFTQGATSALLSAIGNSVYPPMTIRAKNATVITVKTTLTTGTGSISYDSGATINQH